MSKYNLLLLTLFHALLSCMAAWAEAVEPTEQAVQAAFVFNFAKFTEWPAQTFAAPETPFTLCVLGEESFAALRDTTSGKQLQGRVVQVRGEVNAESISECQILFVSAQSSVSQQALAALLPTPRVLTVGDREGFATSGGMIGLFKEEGKIKFTINLKTAERAGLKLSSQLLRLARIVNATPAP